MNHRQWLLNEVLRNGWECGAELGVKAGETLRLLLENIPYLRMYAVDDWKVRAGYDMDGWDHEQYRVQAYAVQAEYQARCTILQMTTLDAAKYVPDGSLDFVFIDADHSEQGVYDDVRHWRPKLKQHGLLIGDDATKATVRNGLDRALGAYNTRGRIWYGRPE